MKAEGGGGLLVQAKAIMNQLALEKHRGWESMTMRDLGIGKGRRKASFGLICEDKQIKTYKLWLPTKGNLGKSSVVFFNNTSERYYLFAYVTHKLKASSNHLHERKSQNYVKDKKKKKSELQTNNGFVGISKSDNTWNMKLKLQNRETG